MKLNPKREHLHLPHKKDGEWDYVTIYDRDGKVLAHSEAHHPEEWIRVAYDGLEYVASPQGEILLSWKTIETKFTKT